MTLRLGTRGSPLALCQSRAIAATLAQGGAEIALEVIKTTGDAWTGSLANVGGKGLFVKELEEALLAGRIDFAVHSLKDMPAELPAGLALVASPQREDTRDVLITRDGSALKDLPPATRVGTSSLRRRAQVLMQRPDLRIVPLRGNVDTRLGKLGEGAVDAIILASAGLRRLGLAPPGARLLPAEEFLPAVGQGALALEAREGDAVVGAALTRLHDPKSAAGVAAERAFLSAVGGDCHTPLAAHTMIDGDALTLQALVAEVDGSESLREEGTAPVAEGRELGRRVAERLLARGAGAIIARAHGRPS